MTTKSDTRTEGETRRQIAERLILEHAPRYAGESDLLVAIEAALNAERERCAKIAESPYGDEVAQRYGHQESVWMPSEHEIAAIISRHLPAGAETVGERNDKKEKKNG